ncbi:MAG: HAD hydrolase family protein, partial [Mogibacterium sp.]|nr:HAD hydrolase family protein [Mogibacterium sp.]
LNTRAEDNYFKYFNSGNMAYKIDGLWGLTEAKENNIEVGGPDTCKRKAIAAFGELFGISQEEIMCCGDAPNDIEMIKYAGIGVAMGNAWGGTKDYADYVTDTNDDDGVAKAIIKFAL